MLRRVMSIPVILLLAAALAAVPLLSAAAQSDVRGRAFSDPGTYQTMDEQWQESDVVHGTEHEKYDMVVNLNQQFYEFMVPHIRSFEREKGLEIAVLRGTCGTTAGMLQKKETDVGAFCCPPGKTDRLPGLRFHLVGIHPISILTHPDNPVENLALQEVREIFQGETVRWSEVGWKDLPIQVVARLHCKKRPGHWKLLLREPDLFGPEVREVGAIEDMFSLVASTPTAIGYEVMWMSAGQNGKVKTLSIDGRNPAELQHLIDGRYPFYRALYLTTWEKDGIAHPLSDELVEYVIAMVERIGEKEGIIPLSRLKESGWVFREAELVGEPP